MFVETLLAIQSVIRTHQMAVMRMVAASAARIRNVLTDTNALMVAASVAMVLAAVTEKCAKMVPVKK